MKSRATSVQTATPRPSRPAARHRKGDHRGRQSKHARKTTSSERVCQLTVQIPEPMRDRINAQADYENCTAAYWAGRALRSKHAVAAALRTLKSQRRTTPRSATPSTDPVQRLASGGTAREVAGALGDAKAALHDAAAAGRTVQLGVRIPLALRLLTGQRALVARVSMKRFIIETLTCQLAIRSRARGDR
jgi:hypothetical protein